MKKSIFSLLSLGAVLLTGCGGKSLSNEELGAKLEALYTANSAETFAAPQAASFSTVMDFVMDTNGVEDLNQKEEMYVDYDLATGYSHLKIVSADGVQEQFVYVDGTSLVIAMQVGEEKLYTSMDCGTAEIALETGKTMITEEQMDIVVASYAQGIQEIETIQNYLLMDSWNHDEDPENDYDLGYTSSFELKISGKDNKGATDVTVSVKGHADADETGSAGSIDGVLKASFNADGYLTYSLDNATLIESMGIGEDAMTMTVKSKIETKIAYSVKPVYPNLDEFEAVEL